MAGDPRIRGEHRSTAGTTASRRGSSPHTRGAPGWRLALVLGVGIIPAYAGSTRPTKSSRSAPMDHPRIRGEHPGIPSHSRVPFGSSPHTRGAPLGKIKLGEYTRIIPAYAGSTSVRHSNSVSFRDHPRIRGEHTHAAAIEATRPGSSPHTRGARLHQARPRGPGRIIPAYAGSTRESISRGPGGGDHPRIRGEHIGAAAHQVKITGSSPHTRGARHGAFVDPFLLGIIPAYAGSTSRASSGVIPVWDHPRIRGEHVASA